ncbi:hypothetical protein C7999DRAFT_30813 [Corynascus novoguineensis]|uniref:DUF6590 domain-containing protein n=1 Tax=Corynascus novoguineensis TaxID=1126955 RepID=A0AAN7CUS6_9PEZI|nr:hypothetical protein C7999DRAFT_30813 [Corynascus novoguineensis]
MADEPTAVMVPSSSSAQPPNLTSPARDKASEIEEAVASKPSTQEYPEPTRVYGKQWKWSNDVKDYVPEDDAEGCDTELYTVYQLKGIPLEPPNQDPPGDEYQVVGKPKRFFQPGRVFAAEWFEPATADILEQQPPPKGLVTKYEGIHGGKPVAKYRWFVVVRRRLHHSLCFRVATYGGKGASKLARGRAADFVVLYRANIEPAAPYPDEEISRPPIAIIIETPGQYISPIARLDCGRIYTVEDNLKVAKIGRVHPSHLSSLDDYYKESVQ